MNIRRFIARPLDEIEQFSRAFPAEVGMPFECMGSPPLCTQEKVDLLVKGGMWRVRLGLESGSERTKQAVYNRPISDDGLRKLISRGLQLILADPRSVYNLRGFLSGRRS
jgi:hypothetical protein